MEVLELCQMEWWTTTELMKYKVGGRQTGKVVARTHHGMASVGEEVSRKPNGGYTLVGKRKTRGLEMPRGKGRTRGLETPGGRRRTRRLEMPRGEGKPGDWRRRGESRTGSIAGGAGGAGELLVQQSGLEPGTTTTQHPKKWEPHELADNPTTNFANFMGWRFTLKVMTTGGT